MDFDKWLTGPTIGVINASQRAALAWRRINDRPTEIMIRRGSGALLRTLTAQTVRLEWDNTATTRDSENVTIGAQKVVAFGVRDHATVMDTDIQRSDSFSIDGVRYEVVSIMTPPGEVQAVCEASKAS